MTLRVQVPESLDLAQVLSFQQAILALPDVDEYVLDFGRMKWATPFGMLLLSDTIRRYRRQRSASRFNATGYEANGYAAHMGFFQSFGLEHGNSPGEAAGGARYLPITVLDFTDYCGSMAWGGEVPQELIESKSRTMAKVLTQMSGGDLVDTFAYALREVVRNAFEHSRSGHVSFCAQYWPSKAKVELAVLDSGVGIEQSLRQNHELIIRNCDDALDLAIAPGISRRTSEQMDAESESVWGNSGFGLYMISRLCGRGGSFAIASGSRCLLIVDGSRNRLDASHEGVALRLVFDTEMVEPVSESLERFRVEGQAVAARVARSRPLSASMLARVSECDK